MKPEELFKAWDHEVWEQTGEALYPQYVSFYCLMAGEHFAYIGGDKAATQEMRAFSNDWHRYSRPCWMR